jgi:hypothetical protein
MERSSNRKGDADFAQVLAQSVTDYIINGTIALRGATHLRNASGTGSIE